MHREWAHTQRLAHHSQSTKDGRPTLARALKVILTHSAPAYWATNLIRPVSRRMAPLAL